MYQFLPKGKKQNVQHLWEGQELCSPWGILAHWMGRVRWHTSIARPGTRMGPAQGRKKNVLSLSFPSSLQQGPAVPFHRRGGADWRIFKGNSCWRIQLGAPPTKVLKGPLPFAKRNPFLDPLQGRSCWDVMDAFGVRTGDSQDAIYLSGTLSRLCLSS